MKKQELAYALLLIGLMINVVTVTAQAGRKETVTYEIQKPEYAEANKAFSLDVILSVQDGWYIYAPTGNNASQGMIETNIAFSLPEHIKRSGKVEIPSPKIKNGFEVLAGKIVMRQPLTATQPGEYQLRGKITWQTCSNEVCLPPITQEFDTILTIN